MTATDTAWLRGPVFRATTVGPVVSQGYISHGLAMVHHGWANPRSETRWDLIHLGSGASVVRLVGSVTSVMPVATEIVDCGDWTLFDMPDGWKQTDPELPEKVAAIRRAHPEVKPSTARGHEITAADARAVTAAREAA